MKKTKLLAPTLYLLPVLLSSKNAYAKEVDISIYPPISEIQIQHASIAKTFIHIKNNTDSSISLKPRIYELKQTDTQKQLITTIDEKSTKQPTITISNEDNTIPLLQSPRTDEKIKDDILVVLSPFEEKNLSLTVKSTTQTVKEDFYRAIIFSPATEKEEQNSTSISSSIGTLLLIANQPKDIAHIVLEEFSATPLQYKTKPELLIKLKNISTTYGKTYGLVQIKDLFGNIHEKATIQPQIVLANQTTTVANTQKGLYQFQANSIGIFTAEIQLKNTEGKIIANRDSYFIILPLQVWITISFFVFFIIGIYLRVRNKLHAKK